ncbi:MAG: hypothetical protein ACN6OP_11290 [Pseudomonadales bacterium]
MAIRKQVLAGTKVEAAEGPGSKLHFKNETTEAPLKGDAGLNNNFSSERLIDPDDVEPTNLHSETQGGKSQKPFPGMAPTTNQPAGAKQQASAKKVKAAEDDCLPNDSHNVSTLPNDVDPTEGYDLEADAEDPDAFTANDPDAFMDADDPNSYEDTGSDAAEVVREVNSSDLEFEEETEDEDGDEDLDGDDEAEGGFDDDDDEIDASDDLLDGAGAPANMLEADEMEEQWDEEAPIEPGDDLTDSLEDLGAEEETAEDLNVPESGSDAEDEMNLVDVDDMADDDVDNMAFASLGASVLVIKKDRVIAKLTRKAAVKAGVEDEMHSDEFQETVEAECKRYGLRAGLQSMGFRMSKVNFAKANVTNKRVEAKVKAATAAVRRTFARKDDSMEHCMALAAVGHNRNLWNDTPNALRAGMENALTAIGVTSASKIVRKVFAMHGVEYANQVVTLAQRLAAQPESARNAVAAMLDMTNPEGPEEADAEDVGTDDADFVDANDGDEAFDDLGMDDAQFEAEEIDSTSVTAALSSAGRPYKGALLTPKQTGTSVTARSVLVGDAPLTFSL